MQYQFGNISNIHKLNSKFNTVHALPPSIIKELWIQHSLTFATIYTPFTVKDMTLLFKRDCKYHTALNYKPKKKVLVKQSYVLLMWLGYITKPTLTVAPGQGASKISINNTAAKADSSAPKILGVPSFFIKPFRNYKTTITRAPMAHKTFSQEQFMVRYYKVNLRFRTCLYKPKPVMAPVLVTSSSSGNNKDIVFTKLQDLEAISTTQALKVNASIYFALKLKVLNPMLSTNMLMLHRYRVHFPSSDANYFTLF